MNNQTQIDLSRLGDADYMCQLGDAMADCGISSLQYDGAGQIVEIETNCTPEQRRSKQKEAHAQQDFGYRAYHDGKPEPDPKANWHLWAGWHAAWIEQHKGAAPPPQLM